MAKKDTDIDISIGILDESHISNNYLQFEKISFFLNKLILMNKYQNLPLRHFLTLWI